MAAKSKDIDWDAVGRDYRAGILSDRAIGKKYGVSHTAVAKKAKEEKWVRDLSKRIEKSREDKVARSLVSTKVAKQRVATDHEVVEANAEVQKNIILEHRQDLRDTRELVKRLLSELGASCMTVEQIHLLADAHVTLMAGPDGERDPKAVAKLTEAWIKSMGLSDRATSVQKLVNALCGLIERERQAFGIDKNTDGQQSIGEFLAGLE
jgi:hypothetical protein